MAYIAELGAETVHLPNLFSFTEQIVEKYLQDREPQPEGPRVTLTHGMLFPGRYPGDQPIITAILHKEQSLLVALEYQERLRALSVGGAAIRQLVVAHSPNSTHYDPDYLQIMQNDWRPLQDDEAVDTRLAWFEQQQPRLMAACKDGSPVTQVYNLGASDVSGNTIGPKASYWSLALEYPSDTHSVLLEPGITTVEAKRQVLATGLMNYEGPHYAGMDVYTGDGLKDFPDTSLPPALVEFEAFWNRVFAEPTQSMDLRAWKK